LTLLRHAQVAVLQKYREYISVWGVVVDRIHGPMTHLFCRSLPGD